MFSCNACLRRAILSISADVPASPLPSSLYSAAPALSKSARTGQPYTHRKITVRTASTLRGLKQGFHRRDLVKALLKKNLPPPNKRRKQVQVTKVQRRDDAARANNEKHLTEHLAPPESQKKIERQAQTEAQYLIDPLRLANEVQRNLKNDGFDKAFALVRASEKQGLIDGKPAGTVNNIVSWNHLCDHCMANGDPRMALKIYNEMKKRGHRPDSHTYTIMLRGFGNNIRKPNAVSDAIKVYNSMFEPNSKLKPNTIHTNAIINVCARGNQMDELWSVAGRLPDKGPGSADHITYTVILKAIERDAIARAAKYVAERGEGADAKDVFASAVEDGRKLWRDVVIKWRRADLRIDESLVCAMGRLLLLSKRRNDVMDVFRLVEQTMGVRPKNGLHDDVDVNAESEKSDQQALTVFSPVPATQISSANSKQESAASSFTYVQPGNNTLSMLMEACLLTKQPALGKSLWYSLTTTTRGYQVVPDANNVVSYLRLLRFSRASSDVLDVLTHPWPKDLKKELNRRGVYIIAMSTCVRDKNNPGVFRVASKIIDAMQSSVADAKNEAVDEDEENEEWKDEQGEERRGLLDVDPQVMAMYLNLAMYTTKGINVRLPLKKTEDGDLDFERETGKNNTLRALHRMGPDTINLNRLMKMKMAEMDLAKMHKDRRGVVRQRIGYEHVHERLEDLMGLVKAMVSAYDRILAVSQRLRDHGKGPLSEDIVIEAKLQKAKLSAYLSKIDKKLYDGDRRGKSGLWEGHDPMKIKEDDTGGEDGKRSPGVRQTSGDVQAEHDADDEVESDTYLHRTPGGARFKKALKKEEKSLETIKEKEMHLRMKRAGFKVEGAKKLSRRQNQEAETERREERREKMKSWDLREGRAVRGSDKGERRTARAVREPRTVVRPRRTESGPRDVKRSAARDGFDAGRADPPASDTREEGTERKSRFNPGIDAWVSEQWAEKRKEGDQVQKAWGGGFGDMARGSESGKIVDLRR